MPNGQPELPLVRFRALITGPTSEGQNRPTMYVEGRWHDAADARKFVIERVLEAWGPGADLLSEWTIEPLADVPPDAVRHRSQRPPDVKF